MTILFFISLAVEKRRWKSSEKYKTINIAECLFIENAEQVAENDEKRRRSR